MLVRIYNDVAVAVRYDPAKHQFAEEYAAIKLGDQKSELKLVRKPVHGSRDRDWAVVDPPINEWVFQMQWVDLRNYLTKAIASINTQK